MKNCFHLPYNANPFIHCKLIHHRSLAIKVVSYKALGDQGQGSFSDLKF